MNNAYSNHIEKLYKEQHNILAELYDQHTTLWLARQEEAQSSRSAVIIEALQAHIDKINGKIKSRIQAIHYYGELHALELEKEGRAEEADQLRTDLEGNYPTV